MPSRIDADVADLDARKQTGERRPLDPEADRTGSNGRLRTSKYGSQLSHRHFLRRRFLDFLGVALRVPYLTIYLASPHKHEVGSYMLRKSAGAGTTTEPISSINCEHFFRGALSLLPVQEFVVGAARPPTKIASASGLMTRGAKQATGLHSSSALQEKRFITPALVLVRSTER
jgi:hypothetical protein